MRTSNFRPFVFLVVSSIVVCAINVVAEPTSGAESGANQLQNPSFDSRTSEFFVEGWFATRDTFAWSPLDAGSSSSSGSVRLTAAEGVASVRLSQCVPNMPGSAVFDFGTKILVPSGQTAAGNLTVTLTWSSKSSCKGDLGSVSATLDPGSPPDTWLSLDGGAVQSPPGARFVGFEVRFDNVASSGSFAFHVDDAFLSTEAPVIRISGDAFSGFFDGEGVEIGRPLKFEASATGCIPGAMNWRWTATSDPAIVGSVTDRPTFTWINNDGGNQEIFVSNLDCGSATASRFVQTAWRFEAIRIEVVKRPTGMIRNAIESDSFTMLYNGAFFGDGDAALTFSSSPIDLEFDPPSITMKHGDLATISVRFPDDIVTNATGSSLSTTVEVSESGLGGDRMLAFPVYMLLADSATGAAIKTVALRVDFSNASEDDDYGVEIRYTNEGDGRFAGLLVPTVPWLDVSAPPLVELEPGETRDVRVTINRRRRPDGAAPLGSVASGVKLLYAESPLGARRLPSSGTATSLATTVTDTKPNPTANVSIPPLQEGEVAFFLPGIGHVQGSVGLFITDVSITNSDASDAVKNLRMYYLPAGSAEAIEAVTPAISTDVATSLADVVKQTFGGEGQLGTLQLRPRLPDSISAVATVFNSSNPSGTYGTAIPLFRSDRSAGAGETIHITGLRKGARSHTNLFLQEVTGASVSVTVRYFDALGSSVGAHGENLGAFGLLQRSDTAPDGSVSVVISVDDSSSGRVIAFATPVDRASGDTWTLTDWRRFYDYSGDQATIVPVAGSVRGANQTYFRTDVSIMNTGAEGATVTLDYFGRAGERVTRVLGIAPGESRLLDDVVADYLDVTGDSVGAIVARPATGDDVLTTSRTYTTIEGQDGTFGTGVPTLGLANALRPGDIRRFGGLEDVTFATIASRRPASFRTNFGIVETDGAPARIRTTIKYPVQASIISTVATLVEASKDYVLAPNQLLLLSNVAKEILGDERETSLGELRNLQIEFEMLEGRAHVFVTSTDNGTGDSILRTE